MLGIATSQLNSRPDATAAATGLQVASARGSDWYLVMRMAVPRPATSVAKRGPATNNIPNCVENHSVDVRLSDRRSVIAHRPATVEPVTRRREACAGVPLHAAMGGVHEAARVR